MGTTIEAYKTEIRPVATRGVRERRFAAGAGFLAFAALGLALGMFGPLVSEFSRRWGVSLAEAGLILPVQAAGFLGAVLLADPVMRRFGRKPVLIGPLPALAGGALGLGFSPNLATGLLMAALIGISCGLPNVGINLYIADLYPRQRAPALNLLNVFFGLGALGGPALISLFTGLSGSGLPALGLVALTATSAAAGLALAHDPTPEAAVSAATPAPGRRGLLTDALVLGGVAFMLVYVGAESGMGGWLPAAAQLDAGMSAAEAPLLATMYWIAVTVIRSFVAWRGAGWAYPAILRAGVAAATLGAALVAAGMAARQPGLLAVGAVLMGLGFGPLFPTLMAVITGTRPQVAGAAAGLLVAAAGLGAIGGPPLVGAILAGYGTTPAMLAVFAGTLLLLGICWFLRRTIAGERRV